MDKTLAGKILNAAKALQPQIVSWRREIHENPEPSYEEEKTSALVARFLDSLAIGVTRVPGKTGVIGNLKAAKARRTVALRADMDALRVQEDTGLPFASKRPGVGHLCGHDAHTAMLLGAAKVLSSLRDSIPNNVRFVFQPAEEIPPGGAKQMLAAGLLDGVDEAFAIHVEPLLPTGIIGVRSGQSMAATDGFRIRVIGKGSHGAAPHMSADPIVAAAEIVLALQTIVSRRVNPIEPAVVSVCKIGAGTQYNVIPAEAELGGTVRTLDAKLRDQMPGWIEEVARGAAAAHGCQVECKYSNGYPILSNHASSVQKARDAAQALFGSEGSIREMPAKMGGEDFAFLLQKVPGALVRMGVTGANITDVVSLHSPKFILDEEALWRGAALYAALACTE